MGTQAEEEKKGKARDRKEAQSWQSWLEIPLFTVSALHKTRRGEVKLNTKLQTHSDLVVPIRPLSGASAEPVS